LPPTFLFFAEARADDGERGKERKGRKESRHLEHLIVVDCSPMLLRFGTDVGEEKKEGEKGRKNATAVRILLASPRA